MSNEVLTNITKLDAANDKLRFIWNNPNQAVIHALQRIISSELNTLAIDMVMIDDNTSILSDKELALRLGLIPMDSRLADSFLLPDECECENFCEKCSVKMTLRVSCYGDRLDVTSKDLYFTDSRTRPVHESGLPDEFLGGKYGENGPGIFIVPLVKNQRIKLSCIVRKGNGKIHGKWNPTSKAVFVPAPVVKVNMKKFHNLNKDMEKKLRKELEVQIREVHTAKVKVALEDRVREEMKGREQDEDYREVFKQTLETRVEDTLLSIIARDIDELVEKNRIDWKSQWINSCPKGVFRDIQDIEDMGNVKGWVKPENNDACIVCNACVMEAEEIMNVQNLIKVKHSEDRFMCKIDGIGVLDVKDILMRSLDVLDGRLECLETEMEKLVF